MDTKDPVVAKTELVINALHYALENNLDINNATDVKKILEKLDPEHTSNVEVAEFMTLLQTADNFMEKDAERRPKLN